MPPKETVPPASVVILVRLVVAPITPLKAVAPEVFTVSALAPLMVEEKVMLPEAELEMTLLFVSVTAAP